MLPCSVAATTRENGLSHRSYVKALLKELPGGRPFGLACICALSSVVGHGLATPACLRRRRDQAMFVKRDGAIGGMKDYVLFSFTSR